MKEPAAALEFELAGVGVQADGRALLRELSWSLPVGGFCLLLGPSGSGKSTLLRVLNRLREVNAGQVLRRGQALSGLDVRQLRREVALVVQEPRLSEGSVRRNLELPVTLGSVPRHECDERIQEALSLAGLQESFLDRAVSSLSGGERRRVALARSLMLRPQALLLDEPTAGLDPAMARDLLGRLSELRQRRPVSVVMTTHRVHEAAAMADRVSVLCDGALVEDGAAEATLKAPRSAALQELLLALQGGYDASTD